MEKEKNKTQFTQEDLDFIPQLKEFLMSCGCTHYYEPKNSISFVDVGNTDNQEKIVNTFIDDLLNGTQTHVYNFWDRREFFLFDKLLENNPPTSHIFKVEICRVLFEHNYKKQFQCAINTKNDKLMLDLFEFKMNYSSREWEKDEQIKYLIELYCSLIAMDKVEMEKVVHSFTHHVKNCAIAINEVELIDVFCRIFPRKYLDMLYQAFDLKHYETSSIEKNTLSIITLSLQKLMESHLSAQDVYNLSQKIIQKEISFPHFFLLQIFSDVLLIAVKGNRVSEKKVTTLFNQIVEKQYPPEKWKDEIGSLIETINEKIDLEEALKANKLEDSEKKAKGTSKI
jgi:hypothetical protein